MIRLLATLLLCLSALQAQARCEGVDLRTRLTPAQTKTLAREAAAIPYGEGNHWIARKGSRTIHVIGTLHLNDPRFNAVMRRLTPLVKSADALLVESASNSTGEPKGTPYQYLDYFLITSGPTLPEVMSKEAWQTLAAAAREIRLDPRIAAHIQPWFLSMLLPESFCGPRGAFAGNGLDNRLERLARRARVPTGSLDTFETVIGALSHPPVAEQARILEYQLQSATGNDHVFVTVRDAYFGQQMAQAMVMEKWQFLANAGGPVRDRARIWANFNNDLLDGRNRGWVPRIVATPGDLLVVAVGASHLPGRNGVLNLLARAGYRLERAAF